MLKSAGLVVSGISPDGELVEIVEIKDHPWFLGCQFHPEFKSNTAQTASALHGVHRRGAEAERGEVIHLASC